MRRTVLLAGILPFVSAFLGGVLAFSLVVPAPATAQSSMRRRFSTLESGRSPLVSIPPFGRGFSRHQGLSIRFGFLKSAEMEPRPNERIGCRVSLL